MFIQIILHEFRAVRPLLNRNNREIFISRRCIGTQTRRRRILQLKLLNSSFDCIEAELRLIVLVSCGDERDVCVFRNLVFRAEFLAEGLDALLHFDAEVLFGDVEVVGGEERLQVLGILVYVLNCIVSTVLTNVLRGELETVLSWGR